MKGLDSDFILSPVGGWEIQLIRNTEIITVHVKFNFAASFNRSEVRGVSGAPSKKQKREKKK